MKCDIIHSSTGEGKTLMTLGFETPDEAVDRIETGANPKGMNGDNDDYCIQ